MRITIRIDENLLAQARRHALETGRTLSEVIEDALRESLARRRECGTRERVELTTVSGRGLRPGVDLATSAGLLDRMEDPE